jgi:hypothetical protein
LSSPEDTRPVNGKELYEHLVYAWGYEGSYRSILRYVRKHYGRPALRTYRRVETPPGAQAQTDWAEYPQMCVGDEERRLHAFVTVLSHSRMPAVVWSEREERAVLAVLPQRRVPPAGWCPGGEPDRQREDGDRAGSGSVRRDQRHLPLVRQGGAVPR